MVLLFIKYLYDWKRSIEPHDNRKFIFDLQVGLESVNSRSTEGNRYLKLFHCGVVCIKPRESMKTVICLKTGSAKRRLYSN